MGKLDRLLFMWSLNSFFLRVRRCIMPLLCVLPLLFCTDCRLSTYDLRYSHPNTPIVEICDRPLDVVRNGGRLWGYNYSSKRLVTDEDEGDLRSFYAADVFFEYVESAPRSSLEHAPPDWGLTCPKPVTILSHESVFFPGELLPLRERCPATGVQAVGRVDPSLFAEPTRAEAPCNSPVQAKKKAPKRVHVCVRPAGVGEKIDEWASRDAKGNLLTNSNKVFAEAVVKAEFIFVFDTAAHPHSVCWFKDAEKLSCPGKQVPKVCNQAVLSELLFAESANSYRYAVSENPKKGDGKTTETSSADGKGPPLDFLESLARNLSIAGALASGDTSGSLKDANGSRYGIPGGKNVGGPNLQILQAAAGTFAIVTNPFKTTKEFIDTVSAALKGRKVTGILNPTVLTKEIAEKLATEPEEKELQAVLKALKEGDTKPLEALEKFGKSMAISLRDAGVILPYSRAKIFTKGWEGKFQAHHALEVEMAKETLHMDAKAIDDIPAIILTEAQHKLITKNLNDVRNRLLKDTGQQYPDKQQLWKIYQEVYKDYPAWLEAIKGYFPNVP